MKPIALSTIRRQNLRKLLDLLTLAPAMTRQELAESAGLSLMTVTNLVDLLKEQDVLRLTPIHRGPMTGRKADAITLQGEKKAWLVVDISNTQFQLTLMGFDMQPLMELKDDRQEAYLPRLEHFLCNVKEQVAQALQGRELLGVAVVTPGPYEISSDMVFNQRLPQINGVKIKALFQRCLGDYEYYVDEDVKFAVRAFPDLMVHSEVLYYLYIGEGVGGAAVHGGNMLRGLNATAGDAGHLRNAEGVTYESHLSTAAFAAMLGLDASVSAAQLQECAAQRPAEYQQAVERMAMVAAEMLHSVLWMLDPTHVIIDCSYAQPCREAFLAAIRSCLQQRFAGENRMLPALSFAAQPISSVLRGAVHVLQREWLERLVS